MRQAILTALSIGTVQGVAELPVDEIIKTLVSIIIGVSYIFDIIRKNYLSKEEKTKYKIRK